MSFQSAIAIIEASPDHPVTERAAPFDMYAAYCTKISAVWGAEKCPTREQWDAMCQQPRGRKITADEFDDNQFSIENGDGAIY